MFYYLLLSHIQKVCDGVDGLVHARLAYLETFIKSCPSCKSGLKFSAYSHAGFFFFRHRFTLIYTDLNLCGLVGGLVRSRCIPQSARVRRFALGAGASGRQMRRRANKRITDRARVFWSSKNAGGAVQNALVASVSSRNQPQIDADGRGCCFAGFGFARFRSVSESIWGADITDGMNRMDRMAQANIQILSIL